MEVLPTGRQPSTNNLSGSAHRRHFTHSDSDSLWPLGLWAGFSVMFSQFSHDVTCISCLFTEEEWHSITQTYCICLRIHMLMDILTASKFWAIMNNKATETPAWFSCAHLLLLWGLYWGMEWQATLCRAFSRNTRLLRIVSLPFYMPCTAGQLCFLHTLTQHLLPAIFLIHHSRGQKVVSHCGFQFESHKWVILLRIFSMLISHLFIFSGKVYSNRLLILKLGCLYIIEP